MTTSSRSKGTKKPAVSPPPKQKVAKPSKQTKHKSAATVTPFKDVKQRSDKPILCLPADKRTRTALNIYRPTVCQCPPTAGSPTHDAVNSYFQSYGYDYIHSIKLKEDRTICNSLEIEDERLYDQPHITGPMRAMLVNWLIDVTHEYKVSDVALHLSISLIDSVLQCKSDKTVHRNNFQALGSACLWMASKIEDRTPMSPDDLIYISDQSFTHSQLLDWEAKVCQLLQFKLQCVTPLHFLNHFLRASQDCGGCCRYPHPVVSQVARYYLDISRLASNSCSPSRLCAAAVFLARVQVFGKGWTSVLNETTGYGREELAPLIRSLYQLRLDAPNDSFGAVQTKYSRPSHGRVAQLVPRTDLGLTEES